MVDTAYWNGEFVADLAAKGPKLGKAQMVSICGRAAAYHTRLAGYEFAMVLVAQTNGLDGNAPSTSFFCGRYRGPWDYRIWPGQLCLAEVFTYLRECLLLVLAEGRQFDPEAVFDQLGICSRQGVLGRQAPVSPIGCGIWEL